MQLENSFVVPVPVETAWQVLLDVERVAPCMPGATLDSVAGDEFTGRVKVKVGPITITYRGTARFVSKDEAARVAVLEASGKETRGAGTAKATVRTELVGQGTETEVRVRTDLAVTGKPAQFGRGVLAEVSGKLIGQFAACLADEVRGQADGAADPDAAPAAGSPAGVPAGGPAGSAPGPDTADATGTAGEATPTPPGAVEPGPGPATPAPPTAAAPPLPPTGAPQAPAPAPAAPIGSVPPPATPATPPRPAAPRQSAEAIDLVGAAGLPLAKRLLPALVAATLVVWVVLRAARRR